MPDAKEFQETYLVKFDETEEFLCGCLRAHPGFYVWFKIDALTEFITAHNLLTGHKIAWSQA